MARKTDIRLRRSNTAGAIPSGSHLNEGELAINTADGALYFKKSDSTVITAHDNTIMHIDSQNDRIGIGTTSPSDKLTVVGNTTLSGDNRHIYFGGSNTFVGENSNSNKLELRGGGSSAADTVYIDSGYVGIGTSVPDSKLTIYNADTGITGLFKLWTNTSNNTAADGGAIEWIGSGDKTAVGSKIAATRVEAGGKMDMRFYTGRNSDSDHEKMRILVNGNVGIGTTTPSELLEVAGDTKVTNLGVNAGAQDYFSSLAARLTVGGNVVINATNPLLYLRSNSTGNDSGIRYQTALKFTNGAGTTHGFIASNGNFGIGNSAPGAKLHVKGDISNSSVADYGLAAFENTNLEGLNIGYDADGNHSYLYSREVGVSSRGLRLNGAIYIDSYDGNVGVGTGTNTLTNKLQVDGFAAIYDGLRLGSAASGEGIFRHNPGTGNNGIGITTGSLNQGGIRLFVQHPTDGGGVGIGTISPDGELHVLGTGGGNGDIYVERPSGAKIHLQAQSANGKIGTSSNHNLGFNTNSTTRATIDTNGRFGIGVIPGYKLHISGATNDNDLVIQNSTHGGSLRLQANTNFMGMFSTSSKPLYFGTNNDVDQMVINTDGKVGIGTNSPSRKLTISDSSQYAMNTLNPTSTAGNKSGIAFHGLNSQSLTQFYAGISANFDNTAGGAQAGSLIFETISSNSIAERMRIDSSGRVNIGNSTNFAAAGADDLQVGNTSGAHGISIISQNSHNGNLFFGDNNNNDAGRIAYNHTNNRMEFYTNRSQRMVITSAGNVGIGTNAAAQKLDVRDGDITTRDSTNTNYAQLSRYVGLTLRGNGTGSRGVQTPNTDALTLGTNNTERVRILSGGNVGIGTASPSATLEVSHDNDGTVDIMRLRNGDSLYSQSFLFQLDTSKDMVITGASGSGGIKFVPGSRGVTVSNKLIVGDTFSIREDGTNDEIKSTGNVLYVKANEYSFQDNSSNERISINSSGAIEFNNAYTFPTSIGSAGQVLKVPSSGTSLIWASDAGGGSATVLTDNDGDTKIQVEESADEDIIRFDTAGSQRMVILANGNVGIGTNAPARNLHIHEGDSTLSYIQITNTTTGATSSDGVSFGITGDEHAAWINRENTDTFISTNNTERVRIKSNGKVGIGTSSPSQILDVVGDLPSIRVGNDNATYRYAAIELGTAGGNWYISNGASKTTSLSDLYISRSTDGTDHRFKFGRDDYALSIYDNADAVKVYLHADGDSYFNGGNVGIGTSSPGARLQVNGSTSDTSATGFIVRNSSGNSLFSVRNDGRIDIPQGNVNITNNLTVSGNLTVDGTTTTLNTATLDVEDKNITLNYGSGDTSATANGAGITIQDAVNSTTDATILWDATNDEFDFSHPIKVAGSLGVTNIVTNKVVKFNGSILDDSNITDDGSTITLGSNTVINGTSNFNGGVSVNVDSSSTGFGNHQAALRIDNTNTTTNNWAALVFDSNNGSSAEVSARFTDHANNYADLYFANRGSGGYTTKMVILQNGNVGIGITNPEAPLDIVKSSSSIQNMLKLQNTNTTAGAGTKVLFQGRDNIGNAVNYGQIVVKHTNTTTEKSELQFWHMKNASPNQAITVNQDGNVGIGVTSPGGHLDVNGTYGDLKVGDPSVGTRLTYYNSQRILMNSNDIMFYTNSLTERMRIKNDGKVGIGTNAPADELHVNGSGDTTVRVTTSSTSLEPKLVFVDGSGDYASLEKVNRDIKIKAFNTDVAYFTNGGRVGIGTSSPSEKLHVTSGSTNSNTFIKIEPGTTAGNYSALQVGRTDGSSVVQLANAVSGGVPISGTAGILLGSNSTLLPAVAIRTPNSSAGHIVFNPKDTEKVRITADGDVGIGTNAPATKLHVANGSDTSDAVRISGGHASRYLAIRTFENNSLVGAGISLNASSSGGAFKFQTASTDRMIINHLGDVGIGTTSPSHKLHVNGGALFNTNTGSNPVYITRSGATDQALKIYTDDANAIFESIQDESLDNYGGFIFAMDAGTTHPFFDVRKGTASSGTKLRVDGSGHVGINEANPDSRLHITGTDGGWDKHITIEHNSSDIGKILVDTDGMKFRNMSSGNGFYFRDNSNATHMFIKSNGFVGIGTTSPLDLIHIKSTTTDARQVIDGHTGYDAELKFAENGTVAYTIGHNAADDTFRIGTTNVDTSPRFVINSAGNVGVGVTSIPSWANFMTNGTAAVGGILYIKQDQKIQALTAFPGGAGYLRINPDGGNVGIGMGTSTPKAKFQVEEYGIDTSETTTTATTQVTIHSFPIADFRSARFTIQITNTTDSTYHTTEILAVHDGTTANITEFGEVHTGSSVEATFDADISSNNFRLRATPTSTNSMTFKVVCHSITI